MIRSFIPISILISCGCGEIEKQSFFPENNLRIPVDTELPSNIDQQQFEDTIDAAVLAMDSVIKGHNESLEVNRYWEDETVNASMTRYGSTVLVNMYGGLARHPLVKMESFALVISHELSHAYCWVYNDNPVYLDQYRKICSEGNADYDGAGSIVPLVLDELVKKGYQIDLSSTEFIDKKCSEFSKAEPKAYSLCVMGLNAGQQLADLLAELSEEEKPNYETPDQTVVTRTARSYPSTVQCRLDNYFTGTLHLPYSKCWYKY